MKALEISEKMKKRIIRKEDLVADKTAFIDARTPGSDKKDNYTIIGPGVSESSKRFINLKEAHGFNIGAAAMPNGCVNSLHSHETAEVFLVSKGTWSFVWGVDGKDGEAVLTEGDVISLPTQMFRGFKNIGSDDGFLLCILGEDNPGKVIWGPKVLEDAKGHGLVLLEDGRLIDTLDGMEIPEDGKVIEPISDEELAQMRKVSVEEMEARVFRFKDRKPFEGAYLDSNLPGGGKKSYGIIGDGMAAVDRPALVNNPHSFCLELVEAEPGNGFKSHKQDVPQVLMVHRGQWKVAWKGEGGEEGEVVLKERDIMSVPTDVYRSIECTGEETGFLHIVSGGDERVVVEWSKEVVEAVGK
ncbi:cupin domain-containing protein [Priestia abyssalis]|uniref:cupin domain-containing protein n=1 Tax=Priestia abyssalis TaxID=1221450 RepID=UPI0014738D34|nr:cupin domain-containing protein [Priestia abyssalis]